MTGSNKTYPSILEYTDGDDVIGTGAMHGKISTPQGPCAYSVEPNGGRSLKRGEPNGPFGSHLETPNQMMGVARDSMSANQSTQGGIATPMDTSKSEMPGVRGSSGYGQAGGGKIVGPFVSPWGDSVG